MNSKNAYELFAEGKKFAEANDYLRAIMLFEKAEEIEPEKGSIREALAVSYFNCGLYSCSKKHFIKALEIDASNDFAHFGLGMCLAKEGKIKEALGNLKIAHAMNPSNHGYGETIKRYNRIFGISHKKQLPEESEE